jgi:adenylate cyclase
MPSTAKKSALSEIILSHQRPVAHKVAMAEERIRRRLAAIMVADVVGYARLMEADEAGTLAELKDRRKTILEPVVRSHGGRIVKLMGDGVLVEFGSAVDAVRSALELQVRMADANGEVADERQITLRIGINLGDVIGDGADVYGEGVNIAARLESLAQPGSVCVSQNVYEQVARKVDGAFEPLGERQLKNIETPVRAYLVRPTLVPPGKLATRSEKPSIAVLPFDNMSGDPAQDYFSDGITEDIITELSRFRELMVIARNSSFAFRGKALDAKDVGHRLGADFIVEGSVRRAANRVRVAQLVETSSGKHRWAERYDRNIEDIFAVQDDVVSTIIGTLVGRVASSSAEHSGRKPTQLWAAHDYFLQGRERSIRFDSQGAAQFLRRAIELDPAHTQAHAWLAGAAYVRHSDHGRREDLEEGLRAAQTAVRLDPLDSSGHRNLGLIYSKLRQYELGGIHLDRAVALNPNDVYASTFRGLWLAFTGRGEEALRSLEADLRRDPFPPAWYWGCRGVALLQLRRHAEALEAFQHVDHLWHWWLPCYIASCQAHLGKIDLAKESAADVLRLKPDFTITDFERAEWWRNQSDLEHITDGMRKAGLK